jgi:hypothetical protein
MKKLFDYLRARRKAKESLKARKDASRRLRRIVRIRKQNKAAQLELNYIEDGNSMGYC